MPDIRYPSFLLACASLVFTCGCHSTHSSSPVNRHNPEAVLRAYFEAWAHNDNETRASFMSNKEVQSMSEPVDSIRILSLVPNQSASTTTRVYSVSFEIKFAGGRSISMEDGRYYWTYTLTWDSTRDSWLISNYGSG